MNNRNLDKALEIISKLINGEKIGDKENASLYDEYSGNSEVYDILINICRNLNLNLYEYNNTLFISAGNKNTVFGFSNEELKKIMGLRVNRELFMTYFIMFNIITEFYKDSSGTSYIEYLRIEDVIKAVDTSLYGVINHNTGIVMEDAELDSFKDMALLWDELPVVSVDDKNEIRAAKNSRSGYVKLTFNFMASQKLFVESGDKYYPTDRFRAIAEKYFEENRGRLYDIMSTATGADTR